jgi:hypothetical protein
VRKWVRWAGVDTGQRSGTSTDESAEIKRLRPAETVIGLFKTVLIKSRGP